MRVSVVKYEITKIIDVDSSDTFSNTNEVTIHVSNLHKLSINRIYIFKR